MLIANKKPIYIIGYQQSSMTQEFLNEITKTHPAEIIDFFNFLKLPDRQQYQYIVSVSVDFNERKQIINLIDKEDLDLITVINDTALLGVSPTPVIYPGTFIFPFCNISIASTIGRHCIIGAYTQVGHYSTVGDNCIIRPGVMILGKSTVGNNCIINARSTLTNNITIADNVEIMAFTNATKNITVAGKYIGSIARRQGDF